MAVNEAYRDQVALLMRIIPLVAEEEVFALKGGTAINLFVRDVPRLSVDIDLTYLPVANRSDSFAGIDAAMKRIEARILKNIDKARVNRSLVEGHVVKLLVQVFRTLVKIELSPVLRGTAYEPELRTVRPAVEEAFGFAEIRVVSLADLYAGKLVAALDRQHPRDLFDVRELLANEGITDDVREAFILYLISHSRPMHEVLARTRKDPEAEYRMGFEGMTADAVPIDDLIATQGTMFEVLLDQMPEHHREFLIGFEEGRPDWSKLSIPHAGALPAVLWRQQNLDALSAEKRGALVDALRKVLAEGKR
jgi:predicted nucleotidyltransferase component of viral defense system